jgi:acetyl esterase/lipase
MQICAMFPKRILIMKGVLICIVMLLCGRGVGAQERVFPIWPGAAPGSEKWKQTEDVVKGPDGNVMVRNITKPTLTAFLPVPGTGNGTAVIVCPGGAFHFLSWESEGTQVAQWLSAHGIAAFVLKYRLVDTGPTQADFQKKVQEMFAQISHPSDDVAPVFVKAIEPFASADGLQAVRMLRSHAADWSINPQRIGILGFSAGATVANDVVFHYDAASRPDFVGSIYPPLWGEPVVPVDAPALFIAAANDDPLIGMGAYRLAELWKKSGHSVETHIYAKGGHGFGMTPHQLPIDHWIDRFGDWLVQQHLM